MSIIETEIWKPNPERPGTVIFDSQRTAQDIFTELEAHLKADGRLPDEYFLFDSHGNWKNGALFPKDGEILCNVNYGGSEGIYLDIAVRYEKDVYEHSRDNGVLGWHKRMVTEGFATGKTLGDDIGDLDKMNLVASSVMAAFYGSKAEIRERYASIEDGTEQRIYPLPPGEQKAVEIPVHAETVKTSKTINGEVKVGDWVIAEPSDEYGCLVGVVTAIDKLGTPEHDTENPGDDIHVDFMAIEYSDKAKAEIFEALDHAHMDADSFDELPLDDVIMASGMLIRITELGHDEIDRLANDYNSAEAYCKTVMGVVGEPESDLFETLRERLEMNMADYYSSLPNDKQQLFDRAWEMAAQQDAYSYMTGRSDEYRDSEVDFFLRFQNPLSVVADEWAREREDINDMSYVLHHVNDTKEALQDYALMPDLKPPSDPTLRRFMDVDLVDFLGKIAEKTLAHYPVDWWVTKDELIKVAQSDNPESKRLMMCVCSIGCTLLPESDVYIKHSEPFERWQRWASDSDAQGYYVEVKRMAGTIVAGNVFEIGDYAEHAKHIREVALPCAGVTLVYSNGDTLRMEKADYDQDPEYYHTLHDDTSPNIYYNAADNLEIAELLNNGRLQRLALPVGSMDDHLRKLTGVLTEVRAPSETPPIEHVSREVIQAYNMQAAEFEKLMYDLLPDASLTAMMNWKGYASDLEANGTHTKAEFFLEMFIEFDLVKQHYGEEIALKLFNHAEYFTMNPFEVRGAASQLQDGRHVSEIEALSVEGMCDRLEDEWNQSQQAIQSFISNEGKYKRPEKTDHERVAQSSPEKPPAKTGQPAAKPKTIADKLQAGKEKSEAYKAQNPSAATKNNKKEID